MDACCYWYQDSSYPSCSGGRDVHFGRQYVFSSPCWLSGCRNTQCFHLSDKLYQWSKTINFDFPRKWRWKKKKSIATNRHFPLGISHLGTYRKKQRQWKSRFGQCCHLFRKRVAVRSPLGTAGCKVCYSATLVAGGTTCHLQACRREELPQGRLVPLAKEILICLSETLPFYIKHIQSVNGRETQSSLVVRTLPMLECYRCYSSKFPISSDWVKSCQGKAVKTSNTETQKNRH